MKLYGRLRLDVLIPHVRRVYSENGRNRLLWLKLERPKNGLKRPILVLTGLRSFSRVFGAQSECLGLEFPLARKARYISGLGSLSGKTLKTAWTLLKHCCLNLPGHNFLFVSRILTLNQYMNSYRRGLRKWCLSKPKTIHP